MTGRLIHTFVGVGVLLAAGCAQDKTITRGLKEAPQLHAALVEAIPLGSSVASAVAFHGAEPLSVFGAAQCGLGR
jgi:hypothetical protein